MKLIDEFPTNKEFSKILKSDYNKSRIQDLLKYSLGKRQRVQGVDIFYVEHNCIDLVDGSEIAELRCCHDKDKDKDEYIFSADRHNDAFHLFTTQNTW